MTWNHRILAHETKDGFFFQVHEVYYNKDYNPISYTENAVSIVGNNLDEINWSLDKIKECTNKPILYAGDKFPNEYSY